MKSLEYIVPVPMGIEAIVAKELRELGYEKQIVENGKVLFQGGMEAIPRANLWLRTGDRLLIKMAEFHATTFEELFQGTKAIPWEEWLPKEAKFPVLGRSHASQLSSVPACQSIVKKAVVERMREKYHLSWFEETGPLYTIEVSLLKNKALITLDTTGPSLHKRGYRELAAQAPIKETLAASLILLSRWSPDRPFHDPVCGSGTIPIEVVLLGRNIAPGLHRTFPSQEWSIVPQRLWDLARGEAKDLARRNLRLEITGTDRDEKVLSLAHYHSRRAGVSETIRFRPLPVKEVALKGEYGVLIANPPYGERIGGDQEVEDLYRQMGRLYERNPSWSFFVITSHPAFEALFGRKATKNRKLYNGRIETHYYQYFGPFPPRKEEEEA
ncbi:putative RNA methyltransferase YpsC [[Clostridium] ultunense Esp]|nr:putative RNA methyltransferase YpsC [[Clostridium] ultunense Esp]